MIRFILMMFLALVRFIRNTADTFATGMPVGEVEFQTELGRRNARLRLETLRSLTRRYAWARFLVASEMDALRAFISEEPRRWVTIPERPGLKGLVLIGLILAAAVVAAAYTGAEGVALASVPMVLTDMTVRQLRAYASERQIPGRSKATRKVDLVSLVVNFHIEESAPKKRRRPRRVKYASPAGPKPASVGSGPGHFGAPPEKSAKKGRLAGAGRVLRRHRVKPVHIPAPDLRKERKLARRAERLAATEAPVVVKAPVVPEAPTAPAPAAVKAPVAPEAPVMPAEKQAFVLDDSIEVSPAVLLTANNQQWRTYMILPIVAAVMAIGLFIESGAVMMAASYLPFAGLGPVQARLREDFAAEMAAKDLELTHVGDFEIIHDVEDEQFVLYVDGRLDGDEISVTATADRTGAFNPDGLIVVVNGDEHQISTTTGGARLVEILQDLQKEVHYDRISETLADGNVLLSDTLTKKGQDLMIRLFKRVIKTLIHRNFLRKELLVVRKVVEETDEVLFSRTETYETKKTSKEEGGEWIVEFEEAEELTYHLVERRMSAPRRPIADRLQARLVHLKDGLDGLDEEGSQLIKTGIQQFLEGRGLRFVTSLDSIWFFHKNPDALALQMGLSFADLVKSPQAMTRMAIFLKRVGSYTRIISLPDRSVDGDSDGTVAALCDPQVTYPVQVTAFQKREGVTQRGKPYTYLVMTKGVVRPVIEVGRRTEAPFYNTDAQFGHRIEKGDLEISVLDKFSKMRARTNLMMALFSYKDPAGFLNEIKERYAKMHLRDLLTPTQMAFVRLGVPLSLFVTADLLVDMLRKYEIPYSYAAKAIGALRTEDGRHVLPVEGAAFPFKEVKRLERELGRSLVVGKDQFMLLRNPPMPDGSSIGVFTYAGIARTPFGTLQDGIVVNAETEQGLRMGLDFDGDPVLAVLVTSESPELDRTGTAVNTDEVRVDKTSSEGERPIETHVGYRTIKTQNGHKKVPYIDWVITDLGLRSGLSQKIGNYANLLIRLRLNEVWNDEVRKDGSTIIQGAVSALKHWVRTNFVRKKVDGLYERVEIDEEVDIVGALGRLKRAKGLQAKAAEMRGGEGVDLPLRKVVENVLHSPETTVLAKTVASVFAEVLELSDRTFAFAGSSEDLAPSMRAAARAVATVRERTAVQKLLKDYKALGVRYALLKDEGADEDVLKSMGPEFDAERVKIAAALRTGRVSTAAFVAEASPRLIVDLLRPQDLVPFAISRKETVVKLAENIKPGEYQDTDLAAKVVDRDISEVLSHGPTVRVMSVKDGYALIERVDTYEDYDFDEVEDDLVDVDSALDPESII